MKKKSSPRLFGCTVGKSTYRSVATGVGLFSALSLVAFFPARTAGWSATRIVLPPPADIFVTVVTAYSSSPDETEGDPFITASGKPVREGVVACSRKYPFGTRFLIQGEVYECLDRLAPSYDHRIDIWKPSKLEALEYGKQRLPVKILSSGENDSVEL